MSETIKPGRYRHFKGKEYEVLYICLLYTSPSPRDA